MKRHSIIPAIILMLSPLAMASTLPASSPTASTISAKAAHVQMVRQKRIAHIRTRIARLEHLESILTSKSETIRLAKLARVKAHITKLQARLAKLQTK